MILPKTKLKRRDTKLERLEFTKIYQIATLNRYILQTILSDNLSICPLLNMKESRLENVLGIMYIVSYKLFLR